MIHIIGSEFKVRILKDSVNEIDNPRDHKVIMKSDLREIEMDYDDSENVYKGTLCEGETYQLIFDGIIDAGWGEKLFLGDRDKLKL